MAHAFTPGLKFFPSRTIVKTRELPVQGRILAREGQAVGAADIVATADLPGELRILRLSEEMGIEPFEVHKGLKVREGEEIKEGTVLCEHKGLLGLFTSRFRAPVSGIIEMITANTGHIGVRLASRPISLNAYLSGRVTAVVEGKRITIEARAAYLQGIFGVGGERQGVLHLLSVPPGKKLVAEDLPPDLAGKVLVGGTEPDIEAVRRASSGGAVGMVVGALDDKMLAQYLGYDLGIALTGDEAIPMTVIATEGFGEMPMSTRVIDLLGVHNGAPVSINGATQVRAGALRPEVIICQAQVKETSSKEETAAAREGGLAVGSKVRLIRVPYFGIQGEVLELPTEKRRIETGAETRVLVAKLQDGRQVVVPRANVELL